MRSVVELWLSIAYLGIPVLLPVLPHSYLSKPDTRVTRSRIGLGSMLAGSLVSGAWFAWGVLHPVAGYPGWPLGLEPLYPGLLASGLPLLLRGFRGRT